MPVMPGSAGSFGSSVDDLTWLITVLGITCLVIAELVLLFCVVRFRRRPDNKRARYLTGVGWPQAKWVLIPVMVVVIFDFVIDISNAQAWHEIKESLPTSGMRVRIKAEQFAWTFIYPGPDGKLGSDDDSSSPNELHVPIYSDVTFELQAKDVLHSFWVPALRLKQDAVPGRVISGWFRATKAGRYDIACAELCGGGHSQMAAVLSVDDRPTYDAWERKLQSTAYASPGARLVAQNGCLGCHSTDGTIKVGPSWKALVGRTETVMDNGQELQVKVDRDYLRTAILRPGQQLVKGFPGVMPVQEGKLTPEQVDQIVEYLETVK